MMLDQLFRVSNDQAITVSAASTNHVDLFAVLRDVSDQRRLVMDFQVTEAFTVNSGTPLLIINNVLDIVSTFNSFPTFLGSSVGHLAAELPLDAHIYVALNPLSTAQRNLLRTSKDGGFPHRFFGAFYGVTGGDFATGKIRAHMAIDVRNELRIEHYADALN